VADNLTNTAENRCLDFINGLTSTAPTTPLKVALMTANGDDATAGTEVTGGGYARQTLTVAAAVNGATSNSADMVFTNMPAVTVVGVEVWDSALTPVRLWHDALSAPKDVDAGDDFRLVASALSQSLS
jgi:hypothetical protein